MEGLTNILWLTMAYLTVSAAMAGLTNVLWAPVADLTVSAAMAGLAILWAPMADLTDFFPSILWAPMADFTDFFPSPNPSFRLRRPTSFATGLSVALSFLPVLVGGG